MHIRIRERLLVPGARPVIDRNIERAGMIYTLEDPVALGSILIDGADDERRLTGRLEESKQ